MLQRKTTEAARCCNASSVVQGTAKKLSVRFYADLVNRTRVTRPNGGYLRPPPRRRRWSYRWSRARPARRADGARVRDGAALFLDRVDDQDDFVVLDHVDHVQPALDHLVDRRDRNAGGGALGGDQREADLHQVARHFHGARLVRRFHRQEHLARLRQLDAGAQLRLDEGFSEGHADAHHFTGRFHFRSEDGVDAREFHEREHGFLDAEVRRHDFLGGALRGQSLANHAARRDLGQLQAGGLGHEGHGARGARVHFQHVDDVPQLAIYILLLDRELHVHQADHVQALGHQRGLALELIDGLLRQRVRRQRAGRIARVHAGLFDVFHHAADEGRFAVGDAIDVALDGVVQEAVQQHRRIVRYLDRFAHVAFQVALLVDDFHRPAAQHIRWTHHQRIADFLRQRQGVGFGAGGAVRRLAQLQLVQQLLETLAVFGGVDHVRRGADDRHAVRFQVQRQLQWRLATVLHDHADRFFQFDDFQHVFQGQRLEVQTVGGVVVGRHGFRITVDHDGLVAVFAHRQRRVDAAVIEFDTLADAVRATAQHHDFFLVGRLGLALFIVGRVHIRGVGREFGGAGVDPLVDRTDVQSVALRAHGLGVGLQQEGQAAVREALLLQFVQRRLVEHVQLLRVEPQLDIDDFLDLDEEPWIDARQRVHFVEREALGECVADVPDALGTGLAQFLFDLLAVLGLFVQAVDAHFQAAQGFLERFLEGAADRHHFADRLHLRRQVVVGGREFLEREARDLGDDVIDRWLERGRGRAAGDLVAQFIEREADGQLGRHFGDREAGGLRRQRRRARHARVHFNDDHAAVGRVDRELHVRAAGVDADLAQHRQRGVAHDLVFLVGQRLRRRDGDRVAGVHAHRVEVFDRADDDAVVRLVAHHFHLVIFPADQGLFDQQFGGRRCLQAALADGLELFFVVGDAAAGAAHRERGTDDDREAQRALHGPGFIHRVRDVRLGRTKADLGHRVLEFEAVFGLVDGLRRGADQLHVVLGQHAVVEQVERAVQRGLAAHGRQDRVRLFLGDDALHHLPGDRLDVGDVGHFRVGHDGRRIAVDQDDFIALFAQGFAGLGAGIIELAGLADNNRASANNQYTFKVCTFRHLIFSPLLPSCR